MVIESLCKDIIADLIQIHVVLLFMYFHKDQSNSVIY